MCSGDNWIIIEIINGKYGKNLERIICDKNETRRYKSLRNSRITLK